MNITRAGARTDIQTELSLDLDPIQCKTFTLIIKIIFNSEIRRIKKFHSNVILQNNLKNSNGKGLTKRKKIV